MSQTPPQGGMLLQLALDAPEHLALVPRLARWVDIIEVGTPLLKRFGLSAITTVRELAGEAVILADTKTADGGALEAEMVLGAGATWMTVLAQASPATREVACQVAARWGATVVFDTILDDSFDAGQLEPLRTGDGLWLAVHSPTDLRQAGGGDETHIERVHHRHQEGLRVSLAGGISRSSIDAVGRVRPDIVVVGSAITTAPDPEGEAAWISNRLAWLRGA
ncbi:MAG: orotidine 5'-phosphate decarboxylase / HUMPS family protein [Arachnia sp.]